MATAPTEAYIEAFDFSRPEDWEDYAQRFEFFLDAQGITDAGKKRATFLSRCGSATFQLAKALVAPAPLGDTPLETILTALREHLAPSLQSLRGDTSSIAVTRHRESLRRPTSLPFVPQRSIASSPPSTLRSGIVLCSGCGATK